MIEVGFTDYGQDWQYILTRKIVKKHGCDAPDVRKTFQNLEFDQIEVAAVSAQCRLRREIPQRDGKWSVP